MVRCSLGRLALSAVVAASLCAGVAAAVSAPPAVACETGPCPNPPPATPAQQQGGGNRFRTTPLWGGHYLDVTPTPGISFTR